MDIEALKHHLNIHSETFYDFADRIGTLSTGALALSITFRKDVAGPSPIGVWSLQLSWAAFVLSLICCTAYRFSKAKTHWEIARNISSGQPFTTASPGRFFNFCFLTGVISFLAGVLAVVVFAILNV